MAIIVGDIHGDFEKTRTFLAYRPEDDHVALGDYLDSFTEPVEEQLKCLNLLIDSSAVLLLGNHDIHYLKKPLFQYPGFNSEQARVFQEILEANIERFKVAYAVDGWLCTHAGANSQYTGSLNDISVIAEAFNRSWESYLKMRFTDPQARYPYQSIFEFNHSIYVEGNQLSADITQIFGHVEHKKPIVESNYIALDTTNSGDTCWIYDTITNKLVPLTMEAKIGRIRVL